MEVRRRFNILPNENPWRLGGHKVSGCEKSERQIDYIEIVAAKHNLVANPRQWFLDVSQSADRSSNLGSDAIATLTTSSKVFAFHHQRVLHGIEHMVLMGHCWQHHEFGSWREGELRKIIRECMFSGSVSLILEAFFLNVSAPWWALKS